MLKKFLIGTFALALMLTVATSVSAFSGATLKQGSKGPDVVELQTKLNITADGNFGPMTKAAVMAFQASNGLTADGVVGPMTLAKLSATVVGGTYPAGCTSNTGFSSTTGQSCAVVTTLPAGCTSTMGYSSTTGAKCDGSTNGGTTPTGPLQGGAGELLYSGTTTDLESDVKEGGSEKVLATKVEADGSDISVTSVKVSFENKSGHGSTRLEKYLDSVDVMLGSTKVGSVDADEFSKDGTEYTKSISLSNAVVRDGDKENLYVSVNTLSSVDEETAEFDGIITQVRYVDATGALFSDSDDDGSDFGTGAVQTFGFDESNVDDSLEVKSSSASPDDETVKVDENDSTDDVLALAFKLDVDEDSADVSVTYMEMVVGVSNYDVDGDATVDTDDDSTSDSAAEAIVEKLVMEVAGEEYELDLDSVSIANGTGTATYTLDLDDDELVVDSGDTEEAKVYLTLNEQDGNYNNGVVVNVKVDVSEMLAETENDELSSVDGSDRTGGDLTLNTSAAVVSNYSWSVNSTGTIVDFFFKVEAEDEDFDVLAADIVEGTPAGTATVVNTSGTPETTEYGVLSRSSGDSVDTVSGGFTVAEGESVTFRLRYSLTGTNGTYKDFTITSVAGNEVPDDKELSPTATLNVTS